MSRFVEPLNTDDVLEWTIELARTAGKQAQSFFGGKLTKTIKGHANDFATDADVAVEKTIVSAIQERYPGDGILAEESGWQGIAGAKNVWIIDPIDGTNNFANHDPEWGVMIARTNGEDIQLSVVNNPETGMIAWAQRGKGTILNGKSVHVGEPTAMQDASVILEKTFDHFQRREIQALRTHIGPCMGRRYSYHSAAANTLHLLAGDNDAYAVNAMKQWDTAPISLLLQEAGYTATNLLGGEYSWRSEDQSLLCAPNPLHKEILTYIASI